MRDKDPVRNLIAIEAAEWFDANRSEITDSQRAAFIEWLKSSPLHVEEYLEVAVVARELLGARMTDKDYLETLLERARSEEDTRIRPSVWRVFGVSDDATPRRWSLAASAALGGLAITLLLLWNSVRTPPPSDGVVAALHFKTGHGELLTRRLADNSTLHLDTDTDVSVRYDRTRRTVVLNAGQAAFEVAHDADRAFRVLAGFAQVVALGTEFDVRLEERSTVVAVVTWRVAVGPVALAEMPGRGRSVGFVEVKANQQISAAAGAWPATPTAVDARYATAWLQRQIVFDHEPLGRVAAEFNRYTAPPIEIETPALRDLPISGEFATDDTESFIAFLRRLKGVRVEVTATAIRVSQS